MSVRVKKGEGRERENNGEERGEIESVCEWGGSVCEQGEQ